MTTKITTYLCDEGLSGISVSDSDNRKSLDVLSVERNETSAVVRTKIATVACSPGAVAKRVVTVKLLPVAGLVDCALFDEHIGDAELSWAREIACDNGGNFVSRDRHITIDVSHPDDPGHWKSSALRGIRKTGETRTYWNTVPAIVSDGLLPDSKGDMVAFDTESRIENGQTQFVPGELLQLLWALKYRDEWIARNVVGSFFATPAFTGGTVTGITNDGTEDKVVVVDVQNVSRSCMPTDWAAYNAGAWAFVLKQGDSAATETNRRSDFGDSDTSSENSSQETGMIGQILNLINGAREAAGLSPMSISPTLTGSAEKHSNDMATNGFTGHTGSDGSTPESRIRTTGYFDLGTGLSAAENVASGYQTADAVFTGWMNSPGHRANIMNPDFVVVGMAVKYDDDGMPYYTQNFGSLNDKLIAVSTPDYRVVPITVNNYGNGGDFETIDYDMLSAGNFEEFFEISQHIGVVTAVDGDNDTADITVDKLGAGSFADVPIFYHCEDSNTVAGGSAAFAVNDEVLVLNEGGKPYPSSGDLVIVGFKDELKSCGHPIIVLFCYNYNVPLEDQRYSFIDIRTKTTYPVYQNNIEIDQPFSLSDLGGESIGDLCGQNGLFQGLQDVFSSVSTTQVKTFAPSTYQTGNSSTRISEDPLIVQYTDWATGINAHGTIAIQKDGIELFSDTFLGTANGSTASTYYNVWVVNEDTTFMVSVGPYWDLNETYSPFDKGVSCYQISNQDEWEDISDYLYAYAGARCYKYCTASLVGQGLYWAAHKKITIETTTIAMGRDIYSALDVSNNLFGWTAAEMVALNEPNRRAANLFAGFGIAAFYECQQKNSGVESVFWVQTNRPKNEIDPDKYQYRWDAFQTMISEAELYALFGTPKESGKFITINQVFV
jgi:uncharacterized protein YkwD